MKIIKITHNRGAEPEEVQEFVWKEGSEEEIRPIAERLVEYTLPIFEGLTLIAQGFKEDGTPVKVFSEGLSNKAYWVRVEIRE